MTGIDEALHRASRSVILCDNKTKNAGITIDMVRFFNEVSIQQNESKRLDYLFTIPK